MTGRTSRPFIGIRVGIVTLDTAHDLVPGNMQHAQSFPFPVMYGVVKGVPFAQIAVGDEAATAPILAAALALEASGVDVIVGACGSFGHYQQAAAAVLSVPVCLSPLVQVPFLLSLLPATKKLAILFARTSAFTARVQQACTIGADHLSRLVLAEADGLEGFRAVMDASLPLDDARLRREVAEHTRMIVQRDPAIGGWLIQCSDLPPYALDIAMATRLPVWDMTVLTCHLYRALAPVRYEAAP